MNAAVVAAVGGLVALGTVASANAPWFSPPTMTVAKRDIIFLDGDARLHGTLYLPEQRGAVPAVVVFHGASEPLAATPLYAHLRAGLPQIGIAVLLFDRRGTGTSSGNPNVPLRTLADDGIAGARAIRAMPQIDPARVGYWGISQGGWLATLAASRDPRAAFSVAVSAPLVPAELQMEFAMSNRLNVLGYSQTDVDEMLDARRKVDGYFNGTNSRDEAVAALTKIETRPWFDLMYLPKASALPANPALSPWREQMDVNFFAAVEQVKVPMLFILGSDDPWIPVSATVTRLRAIASEHPQLEYAVIPNANHLMMTSPAHERMNDADPRQVATEKPDVTAYFTLLAAWLNRVVTALKAK
jgi:dienelactone hydrolase